MSAFQYLTIHRCSIDWKVPLKAFIRWTTRASLVQCCHLVYITSVFDHSLCHIDSTDVSGRTCDSTQGIKMTGILWTGWRHHCVVAVWCLHESFLPFLLLQLHGGCEGLWCCWAPEAMVGGGGLQRSCDHAHGWMNLNINELGVRWPTPDWSTIFGRWEA
jgi:hypothetical protein